MKNVVRNIFQLGSVRLSIDYCPRLEHCCTNAHTISSFFQKQPKLFKLRGAMQVRLIGGKSRIDLQDPSVKRVSRSRGDGMLMSESVVGDVMP
ncbi:hypothetical protein K443DRAFT_682293 [Laccaria amethystina LaAM-08-1]|uniref:Uncharacterized protein n=1 Tax=Laccaria amethystina LaAM-08-1 TaxID=1095629 RepID=A0A0C9XFU6_9AGAR|nr:hypothetical protein K443DRAFT_682293 [Laccaria amethystina LaAM-08-1]